MRPMVSGILQLDRHERERAKRREARGMMKLQQLPRLSRCRLHLRAHEISMRGETLASG